MNQGSSCSHLEKIKKDVPAISDACSDCAKKGKNWSNLRKCLICGNIGCCDSSPEQHARKHFEQTGHEIIEPLVEEPRWKWCYIHKTYL